MLQWLTDGEPTVAVLEFVTVVTDHTAFLSGSVKGGGRLEGTFEKPTTHYKLRITKTYVCNEILGCDITTEEGIEYARNHELFTTTCSDMVALAVQVLEEITQIQL